MTNRKFLTIAASLLVMGSVSANAQIEKKEYNSNWFVGVGGGVTTMYSINTNGEGNGFDTKYMPLGELFAGRWYTPSIGIRFGAQVGQFAPKTGVSQTVDHLNAVYGHGDFMWAATRWLTPYAHAGIFSGMIEPAHSMQNEVAAGLGTVLNTQISDKVDIFGDVRFTLMPERVADVEGSRFTGFTTASLGLKYNLEKFGQNNGKFSGMFLEPSSTRITKDILDDMFFQAGAGINTLNSFNGYGFSGRITPAAEIAVGKWLSNTFAIKAGVQGLTFSHWGKEAPESTFIEHGTYHGENLDIEKFGFTYFNFNFLWDATSIVAGYRPDRTWSFIPYLHGGYINNISINTNKPYITNNEWTAGAGFLNQIQVDENMGIYVDLRAFALNHTLTNNPTDSYTMAGSAIAGIYYGLGRQVVRYKSGKEHIYIDPVKNETLPRDRSRWINGPHDGPYIYNGFFDNWYIGAQAGISTVTTQRVKGFNGIVKPTLDVFMGKWFSPEFGLRAGMQGVQFAFYGNDPQTASKAKPATFKGKEMFKEETDYVFTHADLTWNILNTTRGYKEERMFEIIPYATGGVITTLNPTNHHPWANTLAMGAGAIGSLALNDILRVNADIRTIGMKAKALADYEGGYAFGLSGTLGLTVDLGKNYWGPGNGILLNNLGENWFIMSSGGVSTIDFDAMDIAFNGRVTPSQELMIGRWMSPIFGARVGLQSSSISAYGELPSDNVHYLNADYKGEYLAIEKSQTFYSHADLMWNVLNTFKYNEDRSYDIIPYIAIGNVRGYTSNKTDSKHFVSEFAGGAGLILSKDLDRKVSLYADARITRTKQALTGDTKMSKAYTGNASIGLTYNLGGNNSSLYDVNGWRHLPEENFEQEAAAARWALSTNLVDLIEYGTLNIEAQRMLSRHISTDMTGKLNLWKFADKQIRDQKQSISLGARYWPWYTYSGIWFRGFAQVEEYATASVGDAFRIGRGRAPQKGSAYGAGLGMGYSLMLMKNLNLDFGVSAWGGKTDYFTFYNNRLTMPSAHKQDWFIAPSDVHVSVMWVF